MAAFHDAVEGIVTSGSLQTRLASINRAITAYRALTDAEKQLAQDDVSLLEAAIEDYNATVRDYNADAEKANKSATNG